MSTYSEEVQKSYLTSVRKAPMHQPLRAAVMDFEVVHDRVLRDHIGVRGHMSLQLPGRRNDLRGAAK
ncbi:hypothetical protein GCM10010987_63110 [Bradyrhizobium guangdongense]|uniref:Uncharacterized protein n=1 Tax=Bradyrhizobium guangdongense TaxID=1325090 RepID=A0AA87WDP9_9BRAD|nr:hypothetical protein GCM10010987_63110 [Bradyrhizobium guangdongense]